MAFSVSCPSHPLKGRSSLYRLVLGFLKEWVERKEIQQRYSRVSGGFLEGSSLEDAAVYEGNKLRTKNGNLKRTARTYVPPSMCGKNRKRKLESLELSIIAWTLFF